MRARYSLVGAATAVGALSVLVPGAVNGAVNGAVSSHTVSCGEQGWAATAAGKPSAGPAGSSFLVWHDAGGWHVRVSAATPLVGHVNANAHLGVVAATQSLRLGLQAGTQSLSFHVGSGASGSLDFKASCATRLGFQLGQGSHGPVQVFLGARGMAPASAFRLQRPAATGVVGQIMLGGNCPSIGGGSTCPPAKPIQGSVRIETAATSRGGVGGGHYVKTVQSDAQGNFGTDLAAGHYTLVVEKNGTGYPVAKPSAVEVQAGVMTQVSLLLDSGIR